MAKCSRNGCDQEAFKYPTFSFRAAGVHKGPLAHVTLDLPLCDAHAINDMSLYMNDEGWQTLVDSMKSHGYAPPEKSSLGLTFVDQRPETKN